MAEMALEFRRSANNIGVAYRGDLVRFVQLRVKR